MAADYNRALRFDEFRASLSQATPPPDLTPALRALWTDGRGDWDGAHRIAQDIGGPTGAWVHAYLHRKEGDVGNAGYWYRHAGRPIAVGTLDDEWVAIVTALLE
jgi:hypothetical protein